MYSKYYGLLREPFRLSPDHSYCLRHPSFNKAKAYMQYAARQQEGFVMITGDPGTGKTTLIDELLEEFQRVGFHTASLITSRLEGQDLLPMVCHAFGLPSTGLEKNRLLQNLHDFLAQTHRSGGRPLLIIDEAQGMSKSALEELRLLTNLRADGQPMLQIFLVGQPELRDLVLDPGIEQLQQRVVAACHIDPLSLGETVSYVLHRLRVSGWRGHPTFEPEVFPRLHAFTRGVPRRINIVCSRLLLHGSLEQKAQISGADVDLVVDELTSEHLVARGVLVGAPPGSIDMEGSDVERELAILADPNPFPDEPLPTVPYPPQPKTAPGPAAVLDAERLMRTRETRKHGHGWRWFGVGLLGALLVLGGVLLAPEELLQRLRPESFWSHPLVSDTHRYSSTERVEPQPEPPLALDSQNQGLDVVPVEQSGEQYTTPVSPTPVPDSQNQGLDVVPLEQSGEEYTTPVPPTLVPDNQNQGQDVIPAKPGGAQSAARVTPVSAPLVIADSTELGSGSTPPRESLPTPVSEPEINQLSGSGQDAEPPKRPEPVVIQIPFGFDSAEIAPRHLHLLDEAGRALTASLDSTARIVGFTDSTGPVAYNQLLSERRAKAVADYLQKRGISAARLSVERGSAVELGENASGVMLRTVRIYIDAQHVDARETAAQSR